MNDYEKRSHMTKTLSAETISVVKATVPALAVHGQAITVAMYDRLFRDEAIRGLFNHANQGSNGSQVHALAGAILAYAQNIDNLGALSEVVERIANKHIGFHILPEHYPYVARALLSAISDVLGEAANKDVLDAWGEAYWFLADILIQREAVIRAGIEANLGGWTGWREFVVTEKKRESSVITSFVLTPADGGPVMAHKAGQYLTLRLKAPGQTTLKRNYSISSAPNGESYRISVKREASGQGGSRFLHDDIKIGGKLEATPPSGDFILPEKPQRPVILLSGGVGLTPMVSMIETIVAHHPELETHFIHGTMNSETHAMSEHVRSLAKRHGRTSVSTFYSDPIEQDVVGKTYDMAGFITMNWLSEHTPLAEADIYLCGPKPFLRTFVRALRDAGIDPARIHYEFFGPADELLAA
jgi:nitric oxide dioxygenase